MPVLLPLVGFIVAFPGTVLCIPRVGSIMRFYEVVYSSFTSNDLPT